MGGIESFATLPMWIGFIVFLLGMLALDVWVLGGGHAHKVSTREAVGWCLVWVTLALLFCLLQWWYLDGSLGRAVANEKSLEFLSGYVIEKSLSVDNIFVFLMIFGYFGVPPQLQRRILLFGVLGAIVLRAGMILLGAWLISHFSWIMYLFGAFLVFTGIKMLVVSEQDADLGNNPVLGWLRRHLKVSKDYDGERFFTVQNGIRHATPLLLVLVLIEITDLIFAVDSIPAIFAITTDPFIVFTSNMFAIMGLRALYFLLADIADRFHFLKYGLALVLVFVGGKMLAAYWYHVSTLWSLGIVAGILLISVVASIVSTRSKSDRSDS
ncbi:TerC family protein [Herbaspirillum sp. RTI4]|uniref:TerC family protein n=1 Tax=Herbaspirillum sp. RTI4 TaxID=3048640 RepID=UPI002AB44DF0|nr:TerC family protein [Herbaspirillum sp. RTI4]MDY7578915.1 TerC family protein [Herbaspirillum sp. RTI4]MEA9982004.1 TerC family protein [Herbaspirillum sp. RTI4]